jgi:hypothetical protein
VRESRLVSALIALYFFQSKFMQHTIFRLAQVLALVWLVADSCTKPTSFGEDLLQDQVADYNALTLPVNCTLEYEDSVNTTDKTSAAPYFLCGDLRDPLFGRSQSEIYTQLSLSGDPFNFKSARFDSAFLILPYATDGVYGDTLIPQNLRVYELTDTFKTATAIQYYSTQRIASGNEVGRVDNYLPRPRTVAKLLDTAATATKVAYLKVPLNVAFGEKLVAVDSLNMTNNAPFRRVIRGLHITSEASADPGAMLSFNLNTTRCLIRLYYTRQDTLHFTYDYLLSSGGGIKFTHFEQDRTGSEAANYVGVTNPERMYLQGMGGMRLKMEFPTAAALDSILVNKAQIELNLVPGLTQGGLFAPAEQLIASELNSSGNQVLISDIAYSFSVTGGAGLQLFGGDLETVNESGTSVDRYLLTISKRFQDIVDDTSNDPLKRTLYISIFPQRYTPNRSILYGPGSATFPAKVNLKYTKL